MPASDAPRRLARAALLVAAAALAGAPAVLGAQGAVAQDCDYALVHGTPGSGAVRPGLASHPDSAYVGMAARMAAGQWRQLADSVAGDLRDDADVPPNEKGVFLAQLDSLRGELAAVQGAADAGRLRALARGVTLERFRITPPTAAQPESEYVLFVRGPVPIALGGVPDRARRGLCWRAMALGRMLATYGDSARRGAVRALHDAVTRWDNYTEKGYSQLPWELALNSARFSAASIDPPSSQIILLHPALGVELVAPTFRKLDQLVRTDAITVEPLGYIRYTASRATYYGLSALVSLPSDRRVGVGLIGHAGAYGKVGYVFLRAPDESGRRQRGLVVSADLYQLLSKAPQRLRDAKAAAIAAGAAGLDSAATSPHG